MLVAYPCLRINSYSALGVHVSGLGGGGFMLVRATNASYEFVDFRETAPAAAFQGMFVENIAASETGGLAR